MELQPIPGFDNKPIKFKDKNKYPQSKNKALPYNFFTCLLIGMTGSGKSWTLVKLLKYYESEKIYNTEGDECPQRIILISPTYQSNPIFNTLKNLDPDVDVYEDYSDKILADIMDDIAIVKKEANEYQKIVKIYKKFKKVKKISQLTNYEVMMLEMIDYDIANVAEPRYKINPINFIIFDDLICTPCYRPNSPLCELSTKCRHKGVNLFVLAQAIKQVTKVIRIQSRLLMLYRYNSKSIVDDIYEIVSGSLTPDQFTDIYFKATEEPHSFLTIDNTKSKLELKQNLDSLIIIKNEKNKESKSKSKKNKVIEKEPSLSTVEINK
jgi:hypothetical protein